MSQNTGLNQQPQDTSTPAQQVSGPVNGGSRRKLMLIIIAVVIVIAVALVFVGLSSPSTTLTQTMSQNTTPISMNTAQAQEILESTLSNYNVSDLYNSASLINMSDLISAVPQLYGNATSGWITSASTVNLTSNASIEYFIITTSNTEAISELIGSVVTGALPMSAKIVTSGTEGGLNYTYALYTNSTANMQVLYGWKGNEAVLAIINSNPIFTANQTALINIVSSDTP